MRRAFVHKLPKRKEQLGEVRKISLGNNLDDEAARLQGVVVGSLI
jgi:hypothetical protein